MPHSHDVVVCGASAAAGAITVVEILLSYPHEKIIRFDGSGISELAFEDTEHFAITKDVLANDPQRLEQLLRDDTDQDAVDTDIDHCE